MTKETLGLARILNARNHIPNQKTISLQSDPRSVYHLRLRFLVPFSLITGFRLGIVDYIIYQCAYYKLCYILVIHEYLYC